MAGVGITLGHILALNIHGLVLSGDCLIKHGRYAQARFRIELHTPIGLKGPAHRIITHGLIAGQLMGERPHITGALHIILPPERINPDAAKTDIASEHGKVSQRHHRR